MNKILKSEKGYSLIEIGVGLIIISIFLLSSVTLFNGSYENYRIIQQRNTAMNYATKRMEEILSKDTSEILGIYANLNKSSLQDIANGRTQSQLKDGNYAVPEDLVKGITQGTIKYKDETLNNMVITTSIRRIPESNGIIYDDTVLKIKVKVEYKIKPSDTDDKAQSFELATLKVNT